MTKQRQLILSIIQSSDRHMPTEDIYNLAKEQMPSMVLATVYNNLNALTDMNIIRRIMVPGQKAYYDKNMHPHEHIICDCCGEITDVFVGDLFSILKKRSGIEITDYDLQLHHVCDKCKSRHAQVKSEQ